MYVSQISYILLRLNSAYILVLCAVQHCDKMMSNNSTAMSYQGLFAVYYFYTSTHITRV